MSYEVLGPRTAGQLRRVRIGAIELDIDGVRLLVRGRPVNLPPKQFQLLRELMEHAGQECTRRQLLDAVWGVGHEDAKAVEIHVHRLRRRLALAGGAAEWIRTVRGTGYVLDLADDAVRSGGDAPGSSLP